MPSLPNNRLIDLSKKYAAKYKLPASLVYAMILSESTGDPEAKSGKNAVGLMQLQDTTAKEMGFSHEDMRNPDKNVKAGAGYMAKMLKRFKDPGRALSAYNAGPGATRKNEDLAPGAAPYVHKVGDLVQELTNPGQPFADETDLSDAHSPDRLYRQQIADVVMELINREKEQEGVPYKDVGEPVSISKAFQQNAGGRYHF